MAGKRGRPRLYASDKEKMKAYREGKKRNGAVRVGFYLPLEYKELFTRFCQENNMTMCDAVCHFLDLEYRDKAQGNGLQSSGCSDREIKTA